MNRAALVLVAATSVAACSLLVDLDGISDAPRDLASLGDASSPTPDGADVPQDARSASTLRRITFEDGALIGAPAGVDRIEGDVTLETVTPLAGAFSARVTSKDGQVEPILECDFESSVEIDVSFLLRVYAPPTGTLRIVRLLGNGKTQAELGLRDDARLWVSTPTERAADSPPLVLGTTYRVRIRETAGTAPRVEGYLAAVGDAFGAPFGTVVRADVGGIDELAFGQTVGTHYGMDVVFDDVFVEAL